MENKIKELREEAGYTRERLAQILSVHTNTVKNWENGESDPRSTNLAQMSALFDVSVERVMGLPDDCEKLKAS